MSHLFFAQPRAAELSRKTARGAGVVEKRQENKMKKKFTILQKCDTLNIRQ